MKKVSILFLICQLSISNCHVLVAQNDTTLSRVVTVERDFQPAIQSAGKISQCPVILTPEIQLNPVVYSTYSTPLSIDYNINQLPAAETNFIPQAPLNGILEGAAGHRNTHFLFGYQIQPKKKISLNLFANHDAYWGKDSQSKSAIGADFAYHFNKMDFYANASGNAMHWDYYKSIMDEDYGLVRIDLGSDLLWGANANIGIKSTKKSAFQYRIQTGYSAVGQNLMENMVNTHIDAAWTSNKHTVGVKAYVKNNFYVEHSGDLTGENYSSYKRAQHAIRVEPFYAYSYKNLHLHAGVNIDMNLAPFMNGETWLSQSDKLGFAPSPNVQLSWHSNNNLLHVYANATGWYGTATVDEERMYNPYTSSICESNYIAPYTPIDATIGVKLRPIKTMLLDIYGGYALRLSDYATYVDVYKDLDATNTAFNFISTSYWIGEQSYEQYKIGANLHYHYRDILEINVGGNYYFYHQRPISSVESDDELYYQLANNNDNSGWTTTAFDRPNWDAYARIEAHIDSKWSIYSENYFAGSRQAFILPYTSATIRPTISLNMGGQYAFNRWLSIYAEVNDYLNRKDEIFYGFKSQGIHFLVGVKWKF